MAQNPEPTRELVKHLSRAFLLALVVYIGFYRIDRHYRLRKGPWEITFTADTNRNATIVVRQPGLHLEQVVITMKGEVMTNIARTVVFDVPQKPVPFGRVKFEDLMYLPGTVTLDLFGHEVELLPRTLIVNRRERPWAPRLRLELDPSEKIPEKGQNNGPK